jgi:thiol-disulfide isomerase/thioredoxin
MHRLLPFLAALFLLYSGWQFIQSQYPNFEGISEAQAVPQGIQPIGLATIQKFLKQPGRRVLFLYASWCPYCHKQMEGFKQLKAQYPLDDIIAVSIDKKPEQLLKHYQKVPTTPFEPLIYQGESELMDFLREEGGSFRGGIPYFAIFHDGAYVGESLGLTHPKELAH